MLYPFQERAVDFVCSRPAAALWMEPGLGKTVVSLTAIADLLYRFDIARVLVVAPLRVARHVWPAEIDRWDHTRHLSYRVIAGEKKRRLARMGEVADIHIVNRELVVWLVEELKAEWPYDCVVIDEASSFKSPQAQRFKALRKVRPLIDRVIELTGTPASNGLMDVWAQIALLDRGERLGKTFSAFRARYFLPDYMGYNWTLRRGAEARIHTQIKDVCLTLRATDYLTLPRLIEIDVPIDLPQKAMARYRKLERDFLLTLDDDETVAVFNTAALTNKLLQFANGALYTDDKGTWKEVHTEKLDALADLVAEAAGSPLLVATNFKSDTARIKARFPQAEGLGTDVQTIERWNAGDIPLLIVHPASAGHGLNLQSGGHAIVWFGLNWSLELYTQLNARLHRQGQTKPVIVHHLIAQGTVDETVMHALKTKDTTQRALLDALKHDIGKRL